MVLPLLCAAALFALAPSTHPSADAEVYRLQVWGLLLAIGVPLATLVLLACLPRTIVGKPDAQDSAVRRVIASRVRKKRLAGAAFLAVGIVLALLFRNWAVTTAQQPRILTHALATEAARHGRPLLVQDVTVKMQRVTTRHFTNGAQTSIDYIGTLIGSDVKVSNVAMSRSGGKSVEKQTLRRGVMVWLTFTPKKGGGLAGISAVEAWWWWSALFNILLPLSLIVAGLGLLACADGQAHDIRRHPVWRYLRALAESGRVPGLESALEVEADVVAELADERFVHRLAEHGLAFTAQWMVCSKSGHIAYLPDVSYNLVKTDHTTNGVHTHYSYEATIKYSVRMPKHWGGKLLSQSFSLSASSEQALRALGAEIAIRSRIACWVHAVREMAMATSGAAGPGWRPAHAPHTGGPRARPRPALPQIDYYNVLGVRQTASKAEIARAFRRRALALHPDKNPGREAEVRPAFQAAQAAYEVLGNQERRAEYDKARAMGA